MIQPITKKYLSQKLHVEYFLTCLVIGNLTLGSLLGMLYLRSNAMIAHETSAFPEATLPIYETIRQAFAIITFSRWRSSTIYQQSVII